MDYCAGARAAACEGGLQVCMYVCMYVCIYETKATWITVPEHVQLLVKEAYRYVCMYVCMRLR